MTSNLHGSFQWNELRVRNIEDAKAFYAKLFGWTYDSMPMESGKMPYYLCKAGEQIVAGMMEMSTETGFPDEVPAHWLAYVQVNNVDECLKTTTANGGQLLFGPMDVPGVGRFAVIQDVENVPLGIITPAPTPA